MIVEGRFTLDTNILIYAVDRDEGAKREVACKLVLEASKRDAWLTLQSLAEFFHSVTRKRKARAKQAIAYIQTWERLFPICAADRSSLDDALEAVRDHGLSFWDAMLWATARQAGCGTILSEDMHHGQRLGGVEILDPFRADSQENLDRLLKL